MASRNDDKQKLSGLAALRECMAELTGVPTDKQPQDEGIYWFDTYKAWAAEHGYQLKTVDADEAVAEPHIGLFHWQGDLMAVVMESDKVKTNPTEHEPTVAGLTSRIVVEKAGSTPAKDAKAKQE